MSEETVTTTDKYGNEFETPVGVDGKNPVSVNNPPAKAVTITDASDVDDVATETTTDTGTPSDLKAEDIVGGAETDRAPSSDETQTDETTPDDEK
jgi:hypothetical protein